VRSPNAAPNRLIDRLMPSTSSPDAVVVGAGHNGLVAANLLADAGYSVVVLEASPYAGGAVRSDTSVHPDFISDLFSAFYPLGAASPVLKALELDRHGLTWTHAPKVLTHIWPDGRGASIFADAQRTAESVEAFAPGDGAAWLDLVEQFERISEPLLAALFTPFPPVRSAARLARRMGVAELLRFARFGVTPTRRFGQEQFRGEAGALLIAGNALHADLGPEGAGSALYGWLLAMLAQTVGFPVPVGGSSRLTESLVIRLLARGGELRRSSPVNTVEISDGRAVGVRLAGGELVTARRAVLADVSAPSLYLHLVGPARLPARLVQDLTRFQWDAPTIKLNWALSSPIPWQVPEAHGAGTVHLGADLDGLTHYAASLATGTIPSDPFLLLGQMTTTDGTRSAAGTESAWAYSHLPEGHTLTADETRRHVEVMEAVIERHAPGFQEQILARSVQAPLDLQAANENLHGGAVSGGTAGIHQQLIFRPIPGLGRAETPIDRLYLASASAHPGGGVHGGPGANAARAALRRDGITGSLQRRLLDSAFGRLYSPLGD
jgi:phytoene dehydrogenase-like protein